MPTLRQGPMSTARGRRYRRRFDRRSPPRRIVLSPLLAACRGPAGRLGRRLCEEGDFFPPVRRGTAATPWERAL